MPTFEPTGALAPGAPAAPSQPIEVERRLTVLYAIAHAFAAADELDDVSKRLLQTLVGTLGWQSAALWLPAEDGSTLECAAVHPLDGPLASWAEATSSLRPPIGSGLPGRVWTLGEACWIADTEAEPDFRRRAAAQAVGLRHAFAFPVWVRGNLGAVVELVGSGVREADGEQTAFLSAIADQLGSFIERIETRREVARSDAQKAAILRAAVDAIVVADAEGRIVDFNPAAESLFGRPRYSVIGKHIANVLVPDDLRRQHAAGLGRYLVTGESRILGRRVRTSALHADGSRVPVELTVTAFRIEDRPMFTAFIRDSRPDHAAEAVRAKADLVDLDEAEREPA
jgi:PAS domain S-box-containing protein